MKEIKIKRSNFKLILLLIIGLLIGILCFNMFSNPHKYLSVIFRGELFIMVFGLVSSTFIFLSVVLIVIKYFKNGFGLVINNIGIIDNSNVASLGLIEWKDVKGIRQHTVLSTNFLLIDVYDPEKYLKKSANPILLILRKASVKTYGTPIAISDKSLKCNCTELYNIINEYYEFYLNSDDADISSKYENVPTQVNNMIIDESVKQNKI